ncbi:MAG: 2-C-methyl-D-erythritol 4-phosphate cytidylyltransferase [Clostridiales bacterium]
MRRIVVIPAGGSGTRCDEALPKQYHKVKDKEILAYSIEVFQKCDLIDEIVVSAQSEYFDLISKIADKYGFDKLKKIVEGGKQRQDSVFNAIQAVSAENDDLVAVHDAARPLLSQDILLKAFETAENFGSALVCIHARDTLVVGQNNNIESYLDRAKVFYAQTPQIFRFSILKESMDLAFKEGFYGTDESMLVKRAGYEIKLVEGSIMNFKITTKPDLEIFEKLCGVL